MRGGVRFGGECGDGGDLWGVGRWESISKGVVERKCRYSDGERTVKVSCR